MDISDMLAGGKGMAPVDLDNDPEVAAAVPRAEFRPLVESEFDAADEAEEIDEPKMTAVQRIQAYRAGKIAHPEVGKINDAETDSATASDSTESDTGDGGHSDAAEDDGDDRADYSDVDAIGHKGNGKRNNLLAGFPTSNITRRIPKKGIVIGVPVLVALIVGGGVIPAVSGGGDDKKPAVITPVASAPPKPSPAAPANADVIIKPVSVEGPEYPISVESPMDAFSGQPGKGWVCSGLDGTVLKMTLPEPMRVREIDVLPGLLGTDKDGAELWAKNRVVTSASFLFDYGEPVLATYDKNKREMQPTIFHDPNNPDRGPITKTITMTILYTEDVSGKGAGLSGSSTTSKTPGLFGDLGGLGTDNQASSAPGASDGDSRPATFAIGGIQIMGYSPN